MVGAELLQRVNHGSITGLSGIAKGAVRHHPQQHNRHADVEDRTDDERGDDAKGEITLRVATLFRRRRYRIEPDVGKENDRAARHDAGKAVGRKRMPVRRLYQHAADDQEEENSADLHQHHHIVGAGGFAHAADQQNRQDKNDQECRKIEIGMVPSLRSKDRSGPLVRNVQAK